ncbi:DUF1127 domain-containing protein [Rhizobium mongolense]|uniref:YjiS-like domain-containing protein n=2 Tax=Rhizobium mongolense TaxID=57676 RepID=A0ABR6INB9_9HYPH|nr:DUF1127 domain-containing protein [Rhizobium mongolense]MBB4229379.1 hypothetical protein [Rhizobium mongolense]TVZ73445.1 uncharacterized protein DUF1127 [Rhizobium mongolense USDA 1844]
MAHTDTRAGGSASKTQLFGSTLKCAATIIAALQQWRRTIARRTALADLTPDQLRDIGHPEVNRPVLVIKAGLITNLMSMR